MPASPPEAALIRAAREAIYDGEGLSRRAAARRARISEGTWRNLEDGKVRTPAGNLAAAALVVGVTPSQLSDAGRRDAAGALEQLTAQRAAAPDVAAVMGEPVAHGDAAYQGLMADILAGLAAIDAQPGLTVKVRAQLRAEFLGGLRRSAADWQRQLRVLRDATGLTGPD
jgi:transcriptional regulator with XRE-family HTH domain